LDWRPGAGTEIVEAGGAPMPLNVNLLRQSFEVVATANPNFVSRF
jgi:hypothetical protein